MHQRVETRRDRAKGSGSCSTPPLSTPLRQLACSLSVVHLFVVRLQLQRPSMTAATADNVPFAFASRLTAPNIQASTRHPHAVRSFSSFRRRHTHCHITAKRHTPPAAPPPQHVSSAPFPLFQMQHYPIRNMAVHSCAGPVEDTWQLTVGTVNMDPTVSYDRSTDAHPPT
ncbi:hypothetical protein BKA80DRAFT_281990 [Phyllosticta citrichinensis]